MADRPPLQPPKRPPRPPEPGRNSWSQEFTLLTDQLAQFIEQLLAAGKAQRLIIRKPDDQILLQIPLPTGVALSGILVLAAPTLTAIAALAALYAQVRVEVVYTGPPPSGR